MIENGLPLVITAPSGTGKSTLVKKLLQDYPNFKFSVSCTTRPIRTGEVHGKDYYFMERAEFQQKIRENAFAEWAEVHGNYYGTPLKEVEDNLAQGHDILFDIDVQGALQLSLSLPNSFFVFLFPPSLEELERRLRTRGTDSEEAIVRRLQNAADEIKQSHWFNAWVLNDSIDLAYEQLKACYVTAKLNPRRQKSFLTSILYPNV